ncbi:hypothetical protein EPN44_14125 [bacterium]|nr:MAG: hypothetical protein EPN44_14125 [bacterium]
MASKMFGVIRPYDPASPLTLALIFGYALAAVLVVGGIWLREHLKRRASRMAARHAKIMPTEDLLPYTEIPLLKGRGDDRRRS